MSDPFADKTEVTAVAPKKARGRSVAGITAKAADNLRTDTDSRIKFKRDLSKPRSGGEVDLNLYVPDGTVPAGYVGHWVLDTGKGEIDRMLNSWWGHVTDAQGVNISRISGPYKQYLMAIEEKYKEEIDALQMKNYRDSIGENDKTSLGVQGVESYTPNGESNKIKVTADPFA